MRHGQDGPISFCHHQKCQTGLSAFHVIWECVSYIGYGVFSSVHSKKNQIVLQPPQCNVYLLDGQKVNIEKPHTISTFYLNERKSFVQKKGSMLVIETLKCKISDFLNSNKCFCSRLCAILP